MRTSKRACGDYMLPMSYIGGYHQKVIVSVGLMKEGSMLMQKRNRKLHSYVVVGCKIYKMGRLLELNLKERSARQ